MLHPASERETSRRLRETDAAAELPGLEGDDRALSRKTLYRIADRLQRASEPLQAALFRRERELLDIPEAIAIYDLSNVHFHGGESEPERYGRSKQKRSDCPLATLAPAIDEAGFPMRAEVLPGNVSEPSTPGGAVGRLAKSSSGDAKPTVAVDAGIASEENLEWLRSEGYHWISVDRGSMPPAPEGPPDAEAETAAGLGAKAWLLDKEGGEARLYVAASEGRKRKEDSILALRRKRFEAGLAKLREGLSIKGRMKRRDRIPGASAASRRSIRRSPGTTRSRSSATTGAPTPSRCGSSAAAGTPRRTRRAAPAYCGPREPAGAPKRSCGRTGDCRKSKPLSAR